MSTAQKFVGNTLAKLAKTPTPKILEDRWGNSLRLRLSGFVLVWCMDDRALASPPSAKGKEAKRCDFAIFQTGVRADERARRLALVECMNSVGGDTAEKVLRQFNGGLSILRELAGSEMFSFDVLTPILVHGGTLGKAGAFALGRVRIKPDARRPPVPIRLCKSGSVLKDGGVLASPAA